MCAIYIGVNTGSRASSFELHSYVDSQFSFKFGLVSSQAHDIKRGSERVYPKCRVSLQEFFVNGGCCHFFWEGGGGLSMCHINKDC